MRKEVDFKINSHVIEKYIWLLTNSAAALLVNFHSIRLTTSKTLINLYQTPITAHNGD